MTNDNAAGAQSADGQQGDAPAGGQQQPQQGAPADGRDDPSQDSGETGAPKSDEPGQGSTPRTFTQAELDEIVGREKAKAESKAERRIMRSLEKLAPRAAPQAPGQGQQPSQENAEPTLAQFNGDTEAFARALVDYRLGERDRQAQGQQQQQRLQTMQQRTEALYAEAAKIDGFDRDDFDALDLTPAIVHALTESDVAPELMAVMAESPDEIARIAKLSPARQAAEIGKLEIKAAARKNAPARVSNAPPPMRGIGGRSGSHQGNPADMPAGDYVKMRAAQKPRWYRGG